MLCRYLERQDQNVERLILWGNHIDDDAVLNLSQMPKIKTKLQNLCFCQSTRTIARRGWKELAVALEVNETLKFLDFADENVGDRELLTLGSGLRKNQGLQQLSLSSSGITDFGFRHYLYVPF